MEGIHDGHRDRLRERFREHGLDNFSDINVLELMLCYAIPRRDVNPLAHRLLDTFGSLHGVFEASPEALAQVEGVGENTMILIRLIPQLSRRYQISRQSEQDMLSSSERAGAFLAPRFLYEREEVILMACLDSSCRVITCREVGRGEPNSAVLSVRRVVETALSQNSTSVILAHNHTSGIAVPSQEDVNTTKRIAEALDMVNIHLTDHIVVADDDFVSMADSGML